MLSVAAAVVFVVLAAREGWRLLDAGVNIFVFFPPLLANWEPHTGPGTPFAVLVAVAVVAFGPSFAARASWVRLMFAAWGAAFAWTLSLAMVDGWQNGVATRLASDQEYLYDLPRVTGIGQMLSIFSDHILTTGQDPSQTWFWVTHVGAHPPGAFAVFIGLDQIGLSGGGAAGVVVMLVGASAAAATAVTLKALGAEDLARRALPFAVLFPGAVWVGVSADGMFAGVLAWGVALLALATAASVRGATVAYGLAGGLVATFSIYLSYGLAIGVLFPLAVLAATRRWSILAPALAGAAVVVAAFTLSGFWWLDGFDNVRLIYAGSIAQDRPYEYFVWANIAAVLFALGPAVVAGLRRLVTHPRAVPVGAVLLIAAGVLAVAVADYSGMSKAEVERIWLPFGVWLVLACGLLPRRQVRGWLVAQALLALALNHLLTMPW
ncbi:hypothetical protein I4I78_23695 [Pseudonocardia sp. KRD-291]|nr:hypothetical protein [Pseudonocardia sp. KRD291]